MKKYLLVVVLFLVLTSCGDSLDNSKASLSSSKDKNKSIESLKKFIADGKKQGYFPSRILKKSLSGAIKLQDVNINFRNVIDWVDDLRCPQHEDQIIFALYPENQSVECGFGDTVTLLGPGNDWLDDGWGNDIVYPGAGDDTIDLGHGNDIVIFDKNWGHDTLEIQSKKVDKSKLLNYKGDYPWEFTSFIIFGKGISREEIVWKGNQLVNIKTGDTITLNTKDINILFASAPVSFKKDQMYVPKYQEPELVKLEELNAESVFVKNNTAYYAKGDYGLYIVDLTRLKKPTILSKTVLQGRAMSVQINNDIAYVSQNDSGMSGKHGFVSIIDIKILREPKILSTISFGGGVNNVAVTDKYLYIPESNVRLEDSKLHIYNIKNPSKPKHISTTKMKHYTRYIAYKDETLYLSRRARGIQVYDVRNPKKPKMTSEYGFGGKWVRSIKVHDNKIIVNQHDNKFDVLEPAKGKKLYYWCEVTTPTISKDSISIGVDSIWIRDNYVFRAEGSDGVTITDISKRDNSKTIATIPFKNKWISSVFVIKNTLVAFNERDGSSLYNLDTIFPEHKVEEPSPVIIKKIKMDAQRKKNQYQSLSEDQLQTLLYDAASNDNAEHVADLCTKGARPNMKGHLTHTPIEISAMGGSLNSLKALLRCSKTPPTTKSMIRAALNGEFEAMKLLEQYGGNIGQTDEDGCTTLHYLAQDGTLDMVKYLIEKGVPVNAKCRGGETALKWAQYGKNEAVIEYLKGL
ncbi:MAG: ankyrin repeat domain-containing protein [Thermotogota bacterium]